MKFHTESQHFAPNKIGPPISAVLCAPEYEIFILCPCDSPNDTINENLNCGLPSYDTVSVTQHKSAQSLFILKPGYPCPTLTNTYSHLLHSIQPAL